MLKRIIKLLISLLYLIFLSIKRFILRLFNIPYYHFVILYYHSVKLGEKELFIKQLNYINNFYRVIKADGQNALEQYTKYAAITFDDGYQNLLSNAIPELIKRKFHSTIFVQTDYIGLQPGWNAREDWQDGNEYIMTETQILDLSREFINIGSHTKSHARLTSLNTEDALNELTGSKIFLEKLLNRNVDLFSFPYGSFNDKNVQLAKQAGYKKIFTTEPEIISQLSNYVFGRVTVNPGGWFIEFKIKLAGGYSWFKNTQVS